MAGFGLSPDVYVALACLVAAGAADMISGIFRQTLWNQTIPDEFRGRLAGVELLSYGIGPPAGQFRSGVVASLAGTRVSLVSGGLLCAGAVAVVAALLPGFIRSGKGPGKKGRCPAAQGSAGHRADGVLGRPVPTQGNGVNAEMDRKMLSV
jgi:hypothetical protein